MAANFETVAPGFYLERLLIEGDTIWYADGVGGGTIGLVERQFVVTRR